jgi:hypothetical protein
LFDFDGLGDDSADGVGVWPTLQVREQQAGEVGVHSLVPADELIRESQPGHEAALFYPEDGGKGPREEDTFDGRKGD